MSRLMSVSVVLTALLVAAPSAQAQDDGFVSLFDGRTLDGWVNINCAPDTFGVRDGVITVTGVPICEIRTPRMYENFVLELEYQHQKPMGNAGVFVWADALPARGQPFLRAIEVQVLDGRNSETYTSHGDVFAIHGAVLTPDRPHPNGSMRSLPSERRAKGPGEWNHYRITANKGTIKLAVNGKEVSGGYDISPRKGYIALESEGAPTLFRNIRIKELPSAGALDPSQVATAYEGHTALYDGVSFTGWQPPRDEASRWRTNDWTMAYESTTAAPGKPLTSAGTWGDVEIIADWRWVDEQEPAATQSTPAVAARMLPGVRAVVMPQAGAAMQAAGKWNRVVQRIVGDRLTVSVNGQVVSDAVLQEGLPARGRIALVPAGRKVEFANILVKPLTTAASAQSPVDGAWTFSMSSPMGNVDAAVQLKAEGETLTGSFDLGGGRVWKVQKGTIAGNDIAFVLERDRPSGGSMTYAMKGTIKGAAITGTATAMDNTVEWSMARPK